MFPFDPPENLRSDVFGGIKKENIGKERVNTLPLKNIPTVSKIPSHVYSFTPEQPYDLHLTHTVKAEKKSNILLTGPF